MSDELENDVKLEWRENEDGCWEYGAEVNYGEFESYLGIELVTLLEGTVGQHEGWCVTHDHENDGWFGPLYATREEAMEACVRVHDALYPQFAASLRARPQEPGDFISRSEVLKALQDVRDGAERSREMAATIHDVDAHRHMNVLRQGYESAIEIVSALSAPSGPLSDPEGET